jgi:dipeptidyl aminopeptidase/acylaminoacyl peptidase
MRKTTLGVAAVAVLSALPLHARPQAPGRAMTIDDLLLAVRVSDPQVSPDGRQVVYVRTTTDLKAGRRDGDIYTVPADGSKPPALLIGGAGTQSSPRFSADGKRIAFTSSRDGATQLYVATADGLNVRRVTALAAGVQPPIAFSPDNHHVAFVSDVDPNCADDACNRSRLQEGEDDPVQVRRLSTLLYRHWDEWRPWQRHHVFVVDVDAGPGPVDVTPGDFDSPPHFYEDGAIAFSPTGDRVAFVSKRVGRDQEAWSTNHDVWVVPIAGGDAKKVTPNPAADMQPIFTPDGKSLIVRAQRRAGFESDRWYLDAYDLATGARRVLFQSPDLSVSTFALSPDGRSVWFSAADRGAEKLYTVPAAGGTPKRLTDSGSIAAISPAADFAIVARSSMTSPAEVYRVAVDGSPAKALTSENAAWLQEIEFRAPRSLTVAGANGTPVQYWVLEPPGFTPTQRYPTVFLIHGGPQGAWEDAWSSRWNPALWAAQGWVVVAPNPRGSTGFGQRFVDEISQDWGGKVMVDLDAVFNTVSALPYVDPRRLGIAGASYGGYAVDWIIGHTNRFRAAVSHDGVFNLESMALATEELWFTEWEFGGPATSPAARANFARWSPHLFADRIRTPTLVITNEQDFRVPVDQGLQLFTALRRNGVPAEALVFPDEGHWVLKPLNSKRWHEAVFGWLQRYLR